MWILYHFSFYLRHILVKSQRIILISQNNKIHLKDYSFSIDIFPYICEPNQTPKLWVNTFQIYLNMNSVNKNAHSHSKHIKHWIWNACLRAIATKSTTNYQIIAINKQGHVWERTFLMWSLQPKRESFIHQGEFIT